MRIELAALEDGKGSFSHSYAEGELNLSDSEIHLTVPPHVTGEIETANQAVTVRGKVTARIQVECDRCLKPVDLPVESVFKLQYVTAEAYNAHENAELEVEDLDQTVFDGDAIDVDALVAEELLLAVPDHRLCREDCKGICPVCGADRNAADCGCESKEVDPRWAGLKDLVR